MSLDPETEIEEPVLDVDKGVWVWRVSSPFLGGVNEIEVLLPGRFEERRQYRVLYVLPVFPGIGGPWGDGLQEVRRLGLHDRYSLICVSPAFDTWPYYGAHATDPRIRHEEHLLHVVVPLVESRYPTLPGAEGRLLLGFSKSGWGAFLLTLRNPAFFGYAASWDAPMMMSERNFGLYQTAEHFGSREKMADYVPSRWAVKNAAAFSERCRLVLLGHNFFGTRWLHDLPHTRRFHWLLRKRGLLHRYDNRIKVDHTWNAGWVEPAVDSLVSLASAGL